MRAMGIFGSALALLMASQAGAVGTAFTYQGTLEDAGQPANGLYDLQFRVQDVASAQVGPLLTINDVTLTAGVFTVQLDFGVSVFTGAERYLQIGVRPGASVGSYTILSPSTPIQSTPYAQVADLAMTVANGAVDTSQLAFDAVTASRIATNAVASSEIVDGSVGELELANGSVTTLKLPSGGVPHSRLAGELNTYAIGISVPADSCVDYIVPVGGDINQNDIPLLAMASGTSLPAKVTATALRVTADNEIEIRACNFGTSTATVLNVNFRLITFR